MNKYYSRKKIKQHNAHYNVIFGERSNGKTYQVLDEGFDKYLNSGEVEQLAIIRRWDEDFIGAKSMKTCYESMMCNGDGKNVIKEKSNGKYEGVEYYGGRYFLTAKVGEKVVRTEKIIAIAFTLSSWEHSKSASFPHITTILFDEFMTRGRYLPDEFVIFQNLLSTIIRQRDNVTIWMCANTVSKFGCPYFSEMGLTRVKQMKKGDIDIYRYGNESKLVVAVEFSDSPNKRKPSDVYFAFDNPRLKMITGEGNVWEMNIYPHCPVKYKPSDVIYKYYIRFEGVLLQCNIIITDEWNFTYIHRKTTEIKDEFPLIYQPEHSPRPNIRRNILKRVDDIDRKISYYYLADKVFYQDNEIGELVRSYILFCKNA